MPELTITQAPEPVEGVALVAAGAIYPLYPIPTILSRMLDGVAGQRSEQRVRDTSTSSTMTLSTDCALGKHVRVGRCQVGRVLDGPSGDRPPPSWPPSQGWTQGLMLASESESRGRPLYCVCRE